MSHVPGAHREDAEAANLLHHNLHRGYGGHHAERGDPESAALDARVSAREPPARLPRVRSRWRVRVAGADFRLGKPGTAIHGTEELSSRKISLADGRERSAAVHSLQALHARL